MDKKNRENIFNKKNSETSGIFLGAQNVLTDKQRNCVQRQTPTN
jgi:hypothetical protein